MKSLTCIVAIAILIVGFSACERMSPIVPPTPSPTEVGGNSDSRLGGEISIGVALPLTGHLSTTGKLMKQGFDLALDEINSARLDTPRLKFIIADNISTPAGAATAFNKLIHEEEVSVILGPATSSATQAAFPVAQENQVVAISPTSSARGLSAIGDFVFRIPLTADVVIPKGVQTTQAKLGYQRVATFHDETDLFSTDRNETLQETFTANGIEVLTTETFEGTDTDFSAQLTRIKAVNPDAVFVSALPPEKPGILIQAHQLGISAPVLISSLTNVEIDAAGVAAEGAITFTGWLPTDETPGNQAFVQNYTATFGMEPNTFATVSYAAVYILAEALQNAQSTDSNAIRDALANIRDFDTILGKFSFNADGDAVYEPKVLQVKDGILQPFE